MDDIEFVELRRYGKNKITKEQEIVPLFLDKNSITCFYKDKNGVSISTKQGYVHRVPYTIRELKNLLR